MLRLLSKFFVVRIFNVVIWGSKKVRHTDTESSSAQAVVGISLTLKLNLYKAEFRCLGEIPTYVGMTESFEALTCA
jgi:hypothetical protein